MVLCGVLWCGLCWSCGLLAQPMTSATSKRDLPCTLWSILERALASEHSRDSTILRAYSRQDWLEIEGVHMPARARYTSDGS